MARFNVKRVGKAALVAVVSAALLGGGKLAFDAYMVDHPMRSQVALLEERREVAKSLGLVLHPDELTESRKAGLALYEEFTKFDKYYLNHPELMSLLSSGRSSEKVAEIVLADRKAHDSLVRACSLGNVNVPYDWGHGISSHGPDLFVFSRYANVLCILAEHAYRRHDSPTAVEYMRAAAKLADQVIDEPFVRALAAWESCAYRLIREVYRFAEFDPTEANLAAATEIIALVNPPRDLVQAVRNECLTFQVSARIYDSLSWIERSNLQIAPMIERIEPPEGEYVAQALESRSLAFWSTAVKNAKSPDGDVNTAGRFIDNLCEEWTHEDDPSNYLSRGISATFEQVGAGILRVEQMKRLVLAAIGIASQARTNGGLPQSIPTDRDEHIDPLSKKPFHYRRMAGGFVLQALGDADNDKVAPPVDDLRMVRDQGYALTFEIPN